MQGFPPPIEKRIRFGDGSFMGWPQTRWSYNHIDELVPTKPVWRGSGAAIELLSTPLSLGGLTIETDEGTLRWDEALAASYTDGLLVLHRGDVVFEEYFGASGPHTRHLTMSCNKSVVGVIAESLIDEGVIDPDALVPTILPELAMSAWADATVRNVLDMRVGIAYDEDYTNPASDVWRFLQCTGMIPAGPGNEAISVSEVLPSFAKQGEHGEAFSYQEPNIFVLVWLVRRAAQETLATLVSDRIWQHIGAEHDYVYMLDPSGAETTSAMTLRDFARWGQFVLNRGRVGDRQVLPAHIFDNIFNGGDQAAFAHAGYKTMPNWSYKSQWWIRHVDGRICPEARGAYGQFLYVDPTNDLVIARFGSAKDAPSHLVDPIVLPTFDAITNFVTSERNST
jgi:CubicO group peptidase (beta-lactamase class C family)